MGYGDYVEIGTGDLVFDSPSKSNVDLGNVILLDIEPDRWSEEIVGGKQGLAIDAKEKIRAIQMVVGLDKFTAEIIAIAFGVEIAAVTGSTPNLPTDVGFKIYKGKPVSVCGGGYAGLAGVALADTADAGSPDHVEGTDFEVMQTTGQIVAMESGGIADGATVYIQAGTYTAVTADRLKFPKGFINSKGYWKFTKELDAGGNFVAEIWNGYISEGPTLATRPDGTTEYQITIRSLQDDDHADEESARIDFEAAS